MKIILFCHPGIYLPYPFATFATAKPMCGWQIVTFCHLPWILDAASGKISALPWQMVQNFYLPCMELDEVGTCWGHPSLGPCCNKRFCFRDWLMGWASRHELWATQSTYLCLAQPFCRCKINESLPKFWGAKKGIFSVFKVIKRGNEQ